MDYLIFNLADAHLRQHIDATLLSEEERALAEQRSERYILTRCLLRRELALRLGRQPQELRFRRGEHGKPACEGSDLHFNISHSQDCFAIAFDNTPIGIDVEFMRPRRRMEDLARRIMCAEQFAAFRERGCPQQEFYTCWCTAEALVKQAGSTIWQAGRKPFLCTGAHIQLLADDTLCAQPFTPMPGYAGVVVHHRPLAD